MNLTVREFYEMDLFEFFLMFQEYVKFENLKNGKSAPEPTKRGDGNDLLRMLGG